jgi:hypothetical protein
VVINVYYYVIQVWFNYYIKDTYKVTLPTGSCPPCPVTVNVSCYCGTQQPVTRRCSDKQWACGNPCGKLLICQKHSCSNLCHAEDCKPCPKKSLQKCLCKANQKLRECADPIWKCDEVSVNKIRPFFKTKITIKMIIFIFCE